MADRIAQLKSWRSTNTETQDLNNQPTTLPSIPKEQTSSTPPPHPPPIHENTLAYPTPLLVQILINHQPAFPFSSALIPLLFTNTITSISESIDYVIETNAFGILDMTPQSQKSIH
ncbi:hypothetical protein DL98DRAFT_585349 [Cadophora sp. DSE1049]|nr:hypothetical protein DL98DRAFT_585349 [Cadophora sp. DSE1049]